MVAAVEVPRGARLDAAMIKQLTGGDVVTARALYKPAREMRPEAKILVVANDAPHIDGDADAVWRRLMVIPFDFRVDERHVDRDLTAKLLDERTGILAWAVRGSVEWTENGLGTAPRVEAAIRRMRERMDPIGTFLQECVEIRPGIPGDTVSEFYAAYSRWCDERDLSPLLKRPLSKAVRERAHAETREAGHGGVRRWFGLRLRTGHDRSESEDALGPTESA